MLKYNLKKFYEILQNLGVILNAAVTFYTEDGENTPSNPYSNVIVKHSPTSVCAEAHKCDVQLCRDSDAAVMERLKNPNDLDYFYYVCPCGHIEIASLVKFEDKPVGYILVGPFRAPEANEQAQRRLKRFADKFKLDYDEIKNLYDGAELFTEDKFNAIKVVLSSLVEYMQLKEYVVADEDFFTGYVINYIKNNLDGDLSIEFLCHEFGMSTTLLYKLFKTNTGTTPQQYIKEKRIKKACKLLRSTSYPLKKICSQVGVSDYNYFIKVFKSFLGVTPNQYRNAPDDAMPDFLPAAENNV